MAVGGYPNLSQRRVLLVLGGTIAAVIAAYFWALPAVGGLLALRIPVAWERELGDAVADELAPADAVCDDPALVRTIDGIVARLASGLEDRPYEFRVSVVDDTLVNAFAAPGGRIIVMRGLLAASETPEELAGVLAHEMQHVQLRHGTRAVLRQLPVQAVSAVLGGGGGADGTAALVGTLGVLRYARGDEAEADREGMRLLLATGVDPRGMLDFFETLDQQTGAHAPALTYLSTHPATDERRARLAEMAAESSAPGTALTTDVAWSEIVTLCRAPANPEPSANP
jgi:predicted Zn-dependent protease